MTTGHGAAPGMSRIRVKVVPKAAADRIAGWVGDAVKVRVTAPPERGKANAAVLKLLAAALGVSRENVRLIAGEASAHKVVEIHGLSQDELRSRLDAGPREREVGR